MDLFNAGQDVIDKYSSIEKLLKLHLKNFRMRKEKSTEDLSRLMFLLRKMSGSARKINSKILKGKDLGNVSNIIILLRKRNAFARAAFSKVNFRPMGELAGDVNTFLTNVDVFIKVLNQFFDRKPIVVLGKHIVWDADEHKKPRIVTP